MREIESEWEREDRGHGGREEVINLHLITKVKGMNQTKQHMEIKKREENKKRQIKHLAYRID